MKNKWLKILTNNIGLKILSLLFAVLLWLVSVNINDPVERRLFRDIKVDMKNTEILTAAGKTWEVEGNIKAVNVAVRASRSLVNSLTADDLYVMADFSKMENGQVPVEVSVARYPEGTITAMTPSMTQLKVNVDNYAEKQLVVKLSQTGTPAPGYVATKIATVDTNALHISGPESVVRKVTSAVAEVSVDGLVNDINIGEEIQLRDADGNIVDDPRIEKSVNMTKVSVTILATKEVPIVVHCIGSAGEGYRATGEIEQKPETVVLAGRPAALAEVSQIDIPEEKLDITDAKGDFKTTVDVREYLPDGVIISPESDFVGKMGVTVKIEEIVEKVVEIPAENIVIRNHPVGYVISLDDSHKITVRLRGLRRYVNQMDSSNLFGTIDLEGKQDDLYNAVLNGEIRVPVYVALPEEISQSGEAVANLKVAFQTQTDAEGIAITE